MTAWKTIDTAPKDRPVDLWVPSFGAPVDCRLAGALWDPERGWVDYLSDESFGLDDPKHQPTHWAEIPNGPEEA